MAFVNDEIPPSSAIACSPLWVKMVTYEEAACLILTILLIKKCMPSQQVILFGDLHGTACDKVQSIIIVFSSYEFDG